MSDITQTYSGIVEYLPGTRVSYEDKFYISKRDVIGISPTNDSGDINSDYWELTFSFYDVLRESSPAFLFEDLPTYKVTGIQEFYTEFGNILDSLYLKIKTLNNQISIDTNEGQYLYELSYLLGLENIVQLSKYLNTDGTVNTDLIPEFTYNQHVKNQKMRMKSAISFYLQKGTARAFQNVFTGYGGLIRIIELWQKYTSDVFDTTSKDTEGNVNWQVGVSLSDDTGIMELTGGVIVETSPPTYDSNGNLTFAGTYEISAGTLTVPLSGSMFDYEVFKGEDSLTKDVLDNSLFTKYSSSILFNYSGGEYQQEFFNLYNELYNNGYPEVSNGFTPKQYECNEKNYFFVLNTSGDLLYKTNDDSLSDYILDQTWNLFKQNVSSFILSDDFISLLLNDNTLEIYDNTLETYALSGGTTYSVTGDNEDLTFFTADNVYFIKTIDDLNRIILDRGNYIELRQLDNFYLLSSFTKPVTGEYVEFAVKKNNDDYLIVYTNGQGSVLTGMNSSAMLITNPDTNNYIYDLTSYDIKNVYDRNYNNITFVSNSSGGDSYITKLSFNDTYKMTSSTNFMVSGSEVLDDARYYEKAIFLLENNELSIYDIVKDTYTYTQLPIISGDGYNYTDLFFTDKINIYDNSDTSLILNKILAWNTGTTTLYKTHYFDAKVLRRYEVLKFLPNTTDIIDLINTLKPIHTQLRNVIYYDDISTFGYGNFGLGKFGKGEFGLTDSELEEFYT